MKRFPLILCVFLFFLCIANPLSAQTDWFFVFEQPARGEASASVFFALFSALVGDSDTASIITYSDSPYLALPSLPGSLDGLLRMAGERVFPPGLEVLPVGGSALAGALKLAGQEAALNSRGNSVPCRLVIVSGAGTGEKTEGAADAVAEAFRDGTYYVFVGADPPETLIGEFSDNSVIDPSNPAVSLKECVDNINVKFNLNRNYVYPSPAGTAFSVFGLPKSRKVYVKLTLVFTGVSGDPALTVNNTALENADLYPCGLPSDGAKKTVVSLRRPAAKIYALDSGGIGLEMVIGMEKTNPLFFVFVVGGGILAVVLAVVSAVVFVWKKRAADKESARVICLYRDGEDTGQRYELPPREDGVNIRKFTISVFSICRKLGVQEDVIIEDFANAALIKKVKNNWVIIPPNFETKKETEEEPDGEIDYTGGAAPEKTKQNTVNSVNIESFPPSDWEKFFNDGLTTLKCKKV
ncbi:MAG: hypothetical protein LBE10_11475 [Treponema sp.]|jgi:hypothetical protein|nr:hypothetical protein [Treponema sp.]